MVVIAPHPDDDAIGCGGTLLRLAARGLRINVIYVTDGSASHVKSKRFPPARLRAIREDEARAALLRLGVRSAPLFLRAPDGALSQVDPGQRHQLVAAIARRIAALRARIIFAPWPRDPHPDHVATTAIVQDALAVCGLRPAVYYYRVWLPVRGSAGELPGSDEADVDDVALTQRDVARKRRAIMQHRSQTGALIDDDPEGFCIDAQMLSAWLAPIERFYRPRAAKRVEAVHVS